ncbi:hypothetical protein RHMOL_Rhmol04G0121100 [Rhododendron molle]|uniref:Uncharacterized protein n=1 Tax=Rhododendron molle TaxID=49168 RepID=A0ACC0NZF5_RHOML|nr:hypothetical protein RHMOL_Rhmol04G0121100 [Rhododendron molle]
MVLPSLSCKTTAGDDKYLSLITSIDALNNTVTLIDDGNPKRVWIWTQWSRLRWEIWTRLVWTSRAAKESVVLQGTTEKEVLVFHAMLQTLVTAVALQAAGDLDGDEHANDGGGDDGAGDIQIGAVNNADVGNLQMGAVVFNDAEEENFDGGGDDGNAVVNDGNLQMGAAILNDAEEVYFDADALINDPEEADFHIDALFDDVQAVNQVDPAGDLGGNNGNFQIHAPEPQRTFLRKKLSRIDLLISIPFDPVNGL